MQTDENYQGRVDYKTVYTLIKHYWKSSRGSDKKNTAEAKLIYSTGNF